MFFTSGIVLLTLTINGTTTGWLITKLGMAKENEMSKKMLRQVLDMHDSKASEFIKKWKAERTEHGDHSSNLLNSPEFNFTQLKKTRAKLIEDVKLKKMEKKYPKMTSND